MAKKLAHPNLNDIDLTTVLNALADPIRLEIILNLQRKGQMSCSGSACPTLSKSTISHHYRILREAGIIWSEKDGVTLNNTIRKYELNKRFPGLLEKILRMYKKEK